MVFIPNGDFADDYCRSDDALALMGALASEAADAVPGFAPERTGNYKRSIESASGMVDGCATGRVLSTDFKAVWIEFGTGPPLPTPAHHPLQKAVSVAVKGHR